MSVIQHEASLPLKFWDDPTVDGFHALFMTPKSMLRTYDNVFKLSSLVNLQTSCKKLLLLNELMDQRLGERIHLLAHSLPQDPEHKDQPPLSIGLLLNLEHAPSVLERGPPADNPKAAEFRQLWGSSITEAVLWSGNSISHRRFVLLKIIAHLLELHADIPKSCIRFVGGQLDIVIKVGKEVLHRSECKLWQLKGLPLSITSVQGAHQALRYTQFLVFFDRKKNHIGLAPKENKPCPYYITPIKVENGHMAIRHVKAAFHICLGELLCKQHKYKCHATPTYLDVWKVAYHREPQILRESLTPEGMLIYRDNAEAQALELETLHKPFLTSTLHGYSTYISMQNTLSFVLASGLFR
uniref:Nucleolar protein 6 n=1 Tax=Sinocyclocheilus rhinocerous TaxID=307959 RepID=A0A673LEW0_9TELE